MQTFPQVFHSKKGLHVEWFDHSQCLVDPELRWIYAGAYNHLHSPFDLYEHIWCKFPLVLRHGTFLLMCWWNFSRERNKHKFFWSIIKHNCKIHLLSYWRLSLFFLIHIAGDLIQRYPPFVDLDDSSSMVFSIIFWLYRLQWMMQVVLLSFRTYSTIC